MTESFDGYLGDGSTQTFSEVNIMFHTFYYHGYLFPN